MTFFFLSLLMKKALNFFMKIVRLVEFGRLTIIGEKDSAVILGL